MGKDLRGEELLDVLWHQKLSVPYEVTYHSSASKSSLAKLGTIEADVSGENGRWDPEPFRASKLADFALRTVKFKSVLDVGGGNLSAARHFVQHGKGVTVNEIETSPWLDETLLADSGINAFVQGDFNSLDFGEGEFDLVWVSHVLEHQVNVDHFLKRVLRAALGGYVAIAVPPRKPFIVSGHVNLFNPGLLLYRLVLAGFDASSAKCFQYDNNICVLIPAMRADLPKLKFDAGDLSLLSSFFPIDVQEGFNGDFMSCGLSDSERASLCV